MLQKLQKQLLKNNTTLKHETLKTGLINEKDYNKIVDPKKMISPSTNCFKKIINCISKYYFIKKIFFSN